MTLGFQLYFDKAKKVPTHFPEKILASMPHMTYVVKREIFQEVFADYPWFCAAEKPKLHTIREDASDRWRAGMDIHLVVCNRTPNRYQFAPVIPCVSVQEIFMSYDQRNGLEISIDGKYHYWRSSDLWKNDGFDTVEAFEEYFIKVCKKSWDNYFTGKIIHWTNLKY